MNVLIRVDGDQLIGIGHVVRCMTLAQQCIRQNIKPIFVMKSVSDIFRSAVESMGVVIEVLGSISLDDERTILNKLIQQYCISVIIIDLVHHENLKQKKAFISYVNSLENENIKVMFVDGLHEGAVSYYHKLNVQWLLMPYVGAHAHDYQIQVKTRALLGSEYYLLRDEFLPYLGAHKEHPVMAKNILISCGGSDPYELSLYLLKQIKNFNNNLKVQVVVGPSFDSDYEKRLMREATNTALSISVLKNVDNMAAQFLWADMALISSGLTKYEAAFMGVPAIVLGDAHYNARKNGFESKETGIYFSSDHQEKDLQAAIKLLMDDQELRERFSQNGKRLIDGFGAERVISEVEKELKLC